MSDILLVEDKDSLRQMLRLTLESAGHSVEATGTKLRVVLVQPEGYAMEDRRPIAS